MTRRILVCLLAALSVVAAGAAQDMPDPKQMSGIPLNVADVAPGTVVVRVVKGSLANPLPNQPVELAGGDAPVTEATNDTGRAEFKGLAPGARVKAATTVAGERVESQEMIVPATGGIRVMLVATDPELEKRAAEDRRLAAGPAEPGIVVFGDQSRIVFEMGDEGLSVYNLFQVVNTSRTPVQTAAPLIFDLPDDAEHASMLEGSTPQATLAGTRVSVAGPFAPGMTAVQFAYSLPYGSGTATLQQTVPAALPQFVVLAQKSPDLQIESPQFADRREMSAEGQTYILARGKPLRAGEAITMTFTGLPHEPTWPRNLALALAAIVLAAGVWGSTRTGPAVAAGEARRRRLQAKRDRLFSDLTSLEEQHRAHAIDAGRYAARRRELVAALERTYAEMDEEAAA
jgi:hypothetical protein